MAITLEPVDPLADDTNVPTTQGVDLNINDGGAFHLDLTQTIITVTRGDVAETAYNGGSGGYQGAWSGDAPTGGGTSQIQFRNVARSGGFFEDNDINVRVQSANDNSEVLDDNYDFEIETLGNFRNSGFEAPGTSSSQPKAWTIESNKRGGEGTEWGRIADGSAPEGGFAAYLGNKLLDADETVSWWWRLVADLTDFTDMQSLEFYPKYKGSVIPTGDEWYVKVYVDGVEEFSRLFDDDDDNVDEDWSSLFEIVLSQAYTGNKQVKVLLAYFPDDQAGFVEEMAVEATFDNSTQNRETIDQWNGTFQTFSFATATQAQFDGDTEDRETHDNWS